MTQPWVQLTWAKPGHGKSLDCARIIRRMLNSYKKTEKRYPELKKRYLLCNLKLNEEIERKELGNHLHYWENPKQLRHCGIENCFAEKKDKEGRIIKHPIHDCDLVIDEIANYLPADGWSETPRWFRKLFSQHRHRGIRIVANTQDYKACDINFRRMVQGAYRVRKLIGSRDISPSLPPVRFIWGIILKQRFEPELIETAGVNSTALENEDLNQKYGRPSFFLLTKKLVNTYDTTQDLPAYEPEGFDHRELKCNHPNCDYTRVMHKATF